LLARAFGEANGALISDVVEGGPASVAGIRPGDVLVDVGGRPIDSAEAAATTLRVAEPGTPTTLGIRRQGRAQTIEVTPATTDVVASLARASAAPSAPHARAILPEEILQASNIPPNAVVLRINGRTLSSRAQVTREFRSARQPVPILVQVGDRRFFQAVEPSR
jgi:S1-C subfamily serine protease